MEKQNRKSDGAVNILDNDAFWAILRVCILAFGVERTVPQIDNHPFIGPVLSKNAAAVTC